MFCLSAVLEKEYCLVNTSCWWDSSMTSLIPLVLRALANRSRSDVRSFFFIVVQSEMRRQCFAGFLKPICTGQQVLMFRWCEAFEGWLEPLVFLEFLRYYRIRSSHMRRQRSAILQQCQNRLHGTVSCKSSSCSCTARQPRRRSKSSLHWIFPLKTGLSASKTWTATESYFKQTETIVKLKN